MNLERSLIERPCQDVFVRTVSATSKRNRLRTRHVPVFRDFSGNLYRLALTLKTAGVQNFKDQER